MAPPSPPALTGQGGSRWSTSKIGFMVVFWKRLVRSTGWLLSHQKILILANVIVGQRPALMCNSIVRSITFAFITKTNFSNFKIYLLLQFLSNYPETFRICSRVNLENKCPLKFWFKPLNQNYWILNISELQKIKLMRDQVQNI